MRPFGEQKTIEKGMKPGYLNNFFECFLSKIFIQKKAASHHCEPAPRIREL